MEENRSEYEESPDCELEEQFCQIFPTEDTEEFWLLFRLQEMYENHLSKLFKEYFNKIKEMRKIIEDFNESDSIKSFPCPGISEDRQELCKTEIQHLNIKEELKFHEKLNYFVHFEPKRADGMWRFMEAISDQIQSDPLKNPEFGFIKKPVTPVISKVKERSHHYCAIRKRVVKRKLKRAGKEKVDIVPNLLNRRFIPLLKEMDEKCNDMLNKRGVSEIAKYAYEFVLPRKPHFFDSIPQPWQFVPSRLPRAVNAGMQGRLMQAEGVNNIMNYLDENFLKHQKEHENEISNMQIKKLEIGEEFRKAKQ